MKKEKLREQLTDFLFILPSLLGVSIFVLLPFLDVILRSFQNVTGDNFVGIKNYSTIFHNRAFLLASLNTLKFISICIPLLIVLSLLLAVVLFEGVPGASFIKSAYLVPMAIPVASIVLVWRLLFHEQGILNGFLAAYGHNGQDWMGTNAAFSILVGSYVWKNLGYNIVLWMAGLSGISEEIYQASKVDGTNWIQRFLYITLPILKPTLYMIATLAFLNSFKVFREAYLVAGNYPHESIYMMQHLFNNWFTELSLDKMSAGAAVVAFVIFICIVAMRRLLDTQEY